VLFLLLDGDGEDAKALSVLFLLLFLAEFLWVAVGELKEGFVVDVIISSDVVIPASADSDVDDTIAPREVTLFKTLLAVDTPAAASASSVVGAVSSLLLFLPLEEAAAVEEPSLKSRSLSLLPFVPLLGRTRRYGGICGVLESSMCVTSTGWDRSPPLSLI